MSFEVRTTRPFERAAKVLAKRHRSLKDDLGNLVSTLEANPLQGTELSPGIRKIRMGITSKGSGKSGGARVIAFTIVAAEMEGRVYLLDVYDKSDYSSVGIGALKNMVDDLGI